MAFYCATCRAPLDPQNVEGLLVRCGYCRTAQASPFATARVLASLDPLALGKGGWQPVLTRVRTVPQNPPELIAQHEPTKNLIEHVLDSQGEFDDFEVRLLLRLLWGDLTTSRVTLLFRRNEAGYYSMSLSTQATFALEVVTGKTGKMLVKFSPSDAIRREPGALNDVRVRAEGDRLSLTVNDRTLFALRDATHRQGDVVVAALSAAPMAYAIRRAEIVALDGAPVAAPVPAKAFVAVPAGSGIAVLLVRLGSNKISVIKAIRELTNLGLAEAKAMSERAPVIVGRVATEEEAKRWVAHLLAAGATAGTKR